MNRLWARLDRSGRVLLPAEFRKVLGLRPGDELIVELGEGELRVLGLSEAVRRLQRFVKERVRVDGLLSERLIAERRAEAKKEERDASRPRRDSR